MDQENTTPENQDDQPKVDTDAPQTDQSDDETTETEVDADPAEGVQSSGDLQSDE